MKKYCLVSLLVLVLVSLLLSGCSQPAPSPTPAPTGGSTTAPTTAPATTPAAGPSQVIELKLATHALPSHYLFSKGVLDQWVDKVQTAANGKIKITIYGSESMGKMGDEWNMLKNGVSNIGWLLPHMYPGTFPRSEVYSNPMGIPMEKDFEVINTLFNKYVKDDYAEVKVLWPGNLGVTNVHTSKKPVKSLDDLKGMQIRAAGTAQAAFVKALGATPAVIAPPELYTALERGTVEGTVFPMDAFVSYKLQEVVKYHVVYGLGLGLNVMAMNLKTWNSLPPDVQKAFDDNNAWAQQLMFDKFHEYTLEAVDVCKAANNEFITLSPEESTRWGEALQPVADEWAKNMNAKGLPGTEMVNELRALAAK